MDNSNGTFDAVEELSKIIVANCLMHDTLLAGIKKCKKTGQSVVVSSVKKKKKNFYIPVRSIVEYLSQTYNDSNEFADLYTLKYCFSRLLNDICNDKQKKFGIRFLGLDGVCCYLGTKLNDSKLGFFKLPIKSTDSSGMIYAIDNDKMRTLFTDEYIDFSDGNKSPYEVADYPIDKQEQKNIINDASKITGYPSILIKCLQCCGCARFEEHDNNYYNIVVNVPCVVSNQFDPIAFKVNTSAKINRRRDDKYYSKYCPKCNRVNDGYRCAYLDATRYIDSSFEIDADNNVVLNKNAKMIEIIDYDKCQDLQPINNNAANPSAHETISK